MANAITGIDHAVIGVVNLNQAADAYRRLGFALTPRGRHPRTGTANHCAMFAERNYLELLTVVEPDAADDMFRRAILNGPGLVSLAFQTGDARGVGRSWEAAGLAPRDPIELSRPVETATGRHEARFCLVPLPAERLPGMMGFACQHDTPELVWPAGSTEHPNGARGIVAITGVAETPEALTEIYGRVVGDDRITVDDGALTVATRGAPIHFVTPARLRENFRVDAPPKTPALAALSIAVASLDQVQALLDGNGVPYYAAADGHIVIDPDHASGAAIDFVRR